MEHSDHDEAAKMSLEYTNLAKPHDGPNEGSEKYVKSAKSTRPWEYAG
jgi:hypothetical protein